MEEKMPSQYSVDYEYAGFKYLLGVDQHGVAFSAVPLPDQHPAAMKEKHRRAAIDCFNQRGR
jgi:hypothetical protein